MRLREIQKVIEKNLPSLYGIDFEYIKGSGFKTDRYAEAFLAIIEIEKLGFIDPTFKTLTDNDLLVNSTKSEHVLFAQEKRDMFVRCINQIIFKSEACLALIVNGLHSETEDENSLVISMPNREISFKEFTLITETVNNTLKLLNFLPDFQSDIKLSNFDVGSEWLILTFLSDAAVKTFGRILTIVQRAQVGNIQRRTLNSYLESLELDDKTLSDFKAAATKANKKLYSDLASQIMLEENIENKNELLSQMTKVVENTDRLMSIGVGFEAATSAANEVAATFPPLIEQKKHDQIKNIEAIKKIDNNQDNDAEIEED
jgi:hypothetical protein